MTGERTGRMPDRVRCDQACSRCRQRRCALGYSPHADADHLCETCRKDF